MAFTYRGQNIKLFEMCYGSVELVVKFHNVHSVQAVQRCDAPSVETVETNVNAKPD